LHLYGYMSENQSIIAAAPGIATQVSAHSQTTLTVIETSSRRVVSVDKVGDRKQALAIFRALGEGYDAHIRTPKYSELILSMGNCGIRGKANRIAG
jgi:hypothetical protein